MQIFLFTKCEDYTESYRLVCKHSVCIASEYQTYHFIRPEVHCAFESEGMYIRHYLDNVTRGRMTGKLMEMEEITYFK